MNNLLAVRKIDRFETILSALKTHGFVFRDMIDGGAGWGETSESMIQFGTESSRCFAFEPFPGNHVFFNRRDSRIELLKFALDNTDKTSNFFVPSTVKTNSVWGERGLTGYSSVGFLQKPSWKSIGRQVKSTLLKRKDQGFSIDVECRRGDRVLELVD